MPIINKKEGDTIYIVHYEVINGSDYKRNFFVEACCDTKEQAEEHIAIYYEKDNTSNIKVFECEIKKITTPWA